MIGLLPARLLEQVEPWTRWYRRSWESGTVLALRELSEALIWADQGVLSNGGVDALRMQLRERLGRDEGLNSPAVRQQLNHLLKNPIRPRSQAHRQFDHLVDFISAAYFSNWLQAMENRPERVNIERASRYLAAGVLDVGYDPAWLRKQLKERVRGGASPMDIVETLRGLAQAPRSSFQGIVLIEEASPDLNLEDSDQWVEREEAQALVTGWGQNLPKASFQGALRFEIEAMDVFSAARSVVERLQRFSAQLDFSSRPMTLRYETRFRTAGQVAPFENGRKGVSLRSSSAASKRQAASILRSEPTSLDDAVQLASPLVKAPDSVAAISAWAALESLLAGVPEASDKKGKGVAAERAASIVTANWPRAEMSRLSYADFDTSNDGARLRTQLDEESDGSQARARIILDWLQAGKTIDFTDNADRLALARMEALVMRPSEVLGRVRGYTGAALERLYRQRNMVLHGGHLRPVALRSSLLTAGPLVSCAIDQMIHVQELHDVEPLTLAARAHVALAMCGGDDAWSLVDLAAF